MRSNSNREETALPLPFAVAVFIDMMTSANYQNHCDPHRTNGGVEHVIIATSGAYSKFKTGPSPSSPP